MDSLVASYACGVDRHGIVFVCVCFNAFHSTSLRECRIHIHFGLVHCMAQL